MHNTCKPGEKLKTNYETNGKYLGLLAKTHSHDPLFRLILVI